MMKRTLALPLAIGIALCGLSGCSGSAVAEPLTEYDDLHPVSGQITFNGEPIPDATVRLHPVTPKTDGSLVHHPSGVVKEDGTFAIFTFREEGRGQGAPAGEYRISVSWLGSLEGLSESSIDELKERLPAKYTKPQTSGLTVTVTEGENEIPPISLN